MQFLRKELSKLLPLALLFGAIGGVLLILAVNILQPDRVTILLTYALILALSVYLLNRIRYRKDTKSSVLYGYLVYSTMTLIAFIDTMMNANPDFVNPIFENMAFFSAIFAVVLFISGSIPIMFKKAFIS